MKDYIKIYTAFILAFIFGIFRYRRGFEKLKNWIK